MSTYRRVKMSEVNFIHNRIINPTGGGPSFEDWVSNLLKSAETEEAVEETEVTSTDESAKTASEKAAPGIGIDTDNEPRGQMREKVIYTEGE